MATSGPITYLVIEDQFLSVAATQAPASDYGDVEPAHRSCELVAIAHVIDRWL